MDAGELLKYRGITAYSAKHVEVSAYVPWAKLLRCAELFIRAWWEFVPSQPFSQPKKRSHLRPRPPRQAHLIEVGWTTAAWSERRSAETRNSKARDAVSVLPFSLMEDIHHRTEALLDSTLQLLCRGGIS